MKSKYCLIESRDALESADCARMISLLKGLRAEGGDVVLYLLQNGVFSARKGASSNRHLQELDEQGIPVFVEGFSLRERGISEVLESVKISELAQLVSFLVEEKRRAIWH